MRFKQLTTRGSRPPGGLGTLAGRAREPVAVWPS